jgi:peptidyl-prolyl cis-trans isomerase SurA
MMKLGTIGRAALVLAGSVAAVTAIAQTAGNPPQGNLNIPANPNFFGGDPVLRKATAIVNGDIITGTDVDQRMALVMVANGATNLPPEEVQRLREQVLRNLVDETLQIQAAKAQDIKIEPREIDSYYLEYLKNLKQTPQQFETYLRKAGSSPASLKRQIHGEMAWARVQRRNIEVNVAEEEVRSVIDRLNASKGAEEYRIGEIFLSATPETAAEARANAGRILQQLRQGASFVAYARQFSEASTAAVGGDLGWVRAEQLPEPLAQVARTMPVGTVSEPIAIPGGFSIIAVLDTRKVLTANPRDAVFSLKQMSINFPQGVKRPQADAMIARLIRATQTMGGCGGAEKAAAEIGGEVVSQDQVPARELPPALLDALLGIGVGQATPPYGTLTEGVRTFILCGRDDPETPSVASFDQVRSQIIDERVNSRARRYLRDLRRDAVVDYR